MFSVQTAGGNRSNLGDSPRDILHIILNLEVTFLLLVSLDVFRGVLQLKGENGKTRKI